MPVMNKLPDLKDFESFADTENPPTTWEAAMKALVAGAVDADEVESLIIACADRADEVLDRERPRLEEEAKAKGKRDMTPTWRWICDSYWDLANNGKFGDDCPENVAKTFVQMGQVADMQGKT